MPLNPYRFTGPLDPVEDRSVCIPRTKELAKVIAGILQGDYWVILGPRQMGKTTLLRQIKQELAIYPGIYMDFESSPGCEDAFYRSIINTMRENFAEPAGSGAPPPDRNDPDHKMNFYHFLKTFRPGKEKKIILFFDEIEKAPAVGPFLNLWRKVFHERIDYPELKKYTLVIAGSVDLIPFTIGPTSPFNIARKLYLHHFSPEESEQLIREPLLPLGLTLEAAAKQELMEQTAGHPQLLHHLCHLVTEQFLEEQREITGAAVEDALEERLFLESDNLKTLEQQIKSDPQLRDVVKRILRGEQIKFAPLQHLSLTGVGPIVNRNKYCSLRCPLYEAFLGQLLDLPGPPPNPAVREDTGVAIEQEEFPRYDDSLYKTTIYFREIPGDFSEEEDEVNFLKRLFKCSALTVVLEKDGLERKRIELKGNAKLIFCYLAYKNYKAIKKEGYPGWQSIPDCYKYRLSSSVRNNEAHKPEWRAFLENFAEIGEKSPVDQDIRQWKYALQKILAPLSMADIIDSKTCGRGGGYLLKGTVEFSLLKPN
jgi:hypothetical protein